MGRIDLQREICYTLHRERKFLTTIDILAKVNIELTPHSCFTRMGY